MIKIINNNKKRKCDNCGYTVLIGESYYSFRTFIASYKDKSPCVCYKCNDKINKQEQ